ncbi:MAG: hypothetical protein HFI38_06785 [Lachnospiraceae bacterium]|nr:hypothetical protein [Lachnospiraceae bacterium]
MTISKYTGNRKMNFTILSFALPIMLQVFVTGSINYVDSLTIGKLGDAAVGGVTAVNRFYAVMSAATNSIVSAAGIYISQFMGAGDRKKVRQSFRAGLILTVLVTVPFFGAAMMFPTQIVSFFNRSPAIVAAGASYLNIIKLSYGPLCLSLVISNALYSTGHVKIPLYVSGSVVIFKIGMNLVLLNGVGGAAPGTEAIAAATVAARLGELALYLYLLKKRKYCFCTKVAEVFHVPKDLMKSIFVKAIPFCINNFLWSASNAFLLKVYGARGELEYNAFAITATLHDIFVTINGGFGSAVSILVAQKLGSGSMGESRDFAKRTYGVSLAVSVALSAVMFGQSGLIGIVYQGMSPEVLAMARRLTQLQALGFIPYQMGMHGYYILKAGGDMKSIVIMDSIATWLIQIPIFAFTAYCTGAGVYLLYISSQVGEVIKLAISLRLLRRERWLVNLAGT